MKRLRVLLPATCAIAAIVLVAFGGTVRADRKRGSGRFDLVEATIPSIQTAIQNRIITSNSWYVCT
jgi:hypothetical protein